MTSTSGSVPPSGPAPLRSNSTEWLIIGAAAVLAAGAIFAASMGVTKAQPVAGAVVILGIAYALSTNRRAIDLRTVAWGLGLQIVFALLVLKNRGRPAGVQDPRRLDHAAAGVRQRRGLVRVRRSSATSRRGRRS